LAFYSGPTIFDIIKNNRITNNIHSFELTSGTSQVISNVAVKNIYGDYTYTGSASLFDDLTADDTFMCIRIFHGNLTVDSGQTLQPSKRTRGFFVFVKGNLVNNGEISMTARGSSAPAPDFDVPIWGTAVIPKLGQIGASPADTGNRGSNFGVHGQSPDEQSITLPVRGTGGGGAGGARRAGSTSTYRVISGGGGQGTAWSGGGGGGGASGINANVNIVTNLSNSNLSVGGNARVIASDPPGAIAYYGGGAGNPGGEARRLGANSTSSTSETSYPYVGNNGTGGLLLIVCLNGFTNNGSVTSVGSNGGEGTSVSGGSSGGGSINTIYSFSTTLGAYYADGGISIARTGTVSFEGDGGAGGAGSVTTEDFATASVALPRRTLIKTPDDKLWYRDFASNAWNQAIGAEPIRTYGMLDGEVMTLTKAMIETVPAIDLSDVKIVSVVS
jgi:hypothetical protein